VQPQKEGAQLAKVKLLQVKLLQVLMVMTSNGGCPMTRVKLGAAPKSMDLAKSLTTQTNGWTQLKHRLVSSQWRPRLLVRKANHAAPARIARLR
jgi:hypothetical protein